MIHNDLQERFSVAKGKKPVRESPLRPAEIPISTSVVAEFECYNGNISA